MLLVICMVIVGCVGDVFLCCKVELVVLIMLEMGKFIVEVEVEIEKFVWICYFYVKYVVKYFGD